MKYERKQKGPSVTLCFSCCIARRSDLNPCVFVPVSRRIQHGNMPAGTIGQTAGFRPEAHMTEPGRDDCRAASMESFGEIQLIPALALEEIPRKTVVRAHLRYSCILHPFGCPHPWSCSRGRVLCRRMQVSLHSLSDPLLPLPCSGKRSNIIHHQLSRFDLRRPRRTWLPPAQREESCNMNGIWNFFGILNLTSRAGASNIDAGQSFRLNPVLPFPPTGAPLPAVAHHPSEVTASAPLASCC